MYEQYKVSTCLNCKYFQRYYVIGYDGTFRPTALGCCTNYKVAKSLSNKRVKNDEGCDLWQPYELQKLKMQYCMEFRLQRIEKDVIDVLTVLRDIK